MRISVVGLGKLGLPMACMFAKNNMVVGVDISSSIVDAVNLKECPYNEPQLEAHLKEVSLEATTSITDAVMWTDVTFLIVPTPSDRNGEFDNSYLLEALKGVGEGLKLKKEGNLPARHTVVITSTVMPTSCEKVLGPALEKYSDRKIGDGLNLVYNPEFVALGSVIKNMTHPDFILIGESNEAGGQIVEAVHRSYLSDDIPAKRMSLVSAEVAKLALNTYVTTKISFANTVAELCEQLPGASARDVCDAIGLDRRIGQKAIIPATAFGGPCFVRDAVAFAAMSYNLGLTAELAEATTSVNQRQAKRLYEMVRKTNPTVVGVFGLTYKPDTPVTEESVGLKLMTMLTSRGVKTYGYDPMLHSREGLDLILAMCDTIVITTPHLDFKLLDFSAKTVIDCWDIVKTGNIIRVGEGL